MKRGSWLIIFFGLFVFLPTISAVADEGAKVPSMHRPAMLTNPWLKFQQEEARNKSFQICLAELSSNLVDYDDKSSGSDNSNLVYGRALLACVRDHKNTMDLQDFDGLVSRINRHRTSLKNNPEIRHINSWFEDAVYSAAVFLVSNQGGGISAERMGEILESVKDILPADQDKAWAVLTTYISVQLEACKAGNQETVTKCVRNITQAIVDFNLREVRLTFNENGEIDPLILPWSFVKRLDYLSKVGRELGDKLSQTHMYLLIGTCRKLLRDTESAYSQQQRGSEPRAAQHEANQGVDPGVKKFLDSAAEATKVFIDSIVESYVAAHAVSLNIHEFDAIQLELHSREASDRASRIWRDAGSGTRKPSDSAVRDPLP